MRLAIFILLGLSWGCSSKKVEEHNQLHIACSANMQFVVEELIAEFYEQTGIECKTYINSSGSLTAQVKEGAPYDLFLSADMKYPLDLFQHALTIDSPMVYATGKLILWTTDTSFTPDIDALSRTEIRHIAIANANTAPYGAATEQVLKYYNLYDVLKDKYVYGESISHVNHFVNSGAAEVGFTALSVPKSGKINGNWFVIAEDSYPAIEQGVVILKNTKHMEQAIQFKQFLFSATSKKILTEYGYTVTIE